MTQYISKEEVLKIIESNDYDITGNVDAINRLTTIELE